MLAPNLTVISIEASLNFYVGVLGFKELGKMPGPDGKLVHAMIQWQDVFFMFGTMDWLPPEDALHRGKGVNFYIYGSDDFDLDGFYKQLKAQDVTIVEEIDDRFWGDRSFIIVDPDGYNLTFAKQVRLVSEEEMAEIMKSMPPM